MHLIDLNTEPPGGYKYTQPETGHTMTGRPFTGLLKSVIQHRSNNKLPAVGQDYSSLESEIQDALCRSLTPKDQVRLCSDAPPLPWPIYLQPFKLMARPIDRGLGDIIARTIGPVGGDAFKEWYQKTIGQDCGCRDRQIHLNNLYPL